MCALVFFCVEGMNIQEHTSKLTEQFALSGIQYTEGTIWEELSNNTDILCELSMFKERSVKAESVFPCRLAALKVLNSMKHNAIDGSADHYYEEDNPVQASIEALEIRLFELCKLYCEEYGSSDIRKDSNDLYQKLKAYIYDVVSL
jgi:hypothetical protein